jgi:hypothetical protein
VTTIWDDNDVRQIYVMQGGGPNLEFSALNALPEESRKQLAEFFQADQQVGGDSTLADYNYALVTGVRAFDLLPRSFSTGWRKFILFQTGCNVQLFHAANLMPTVVADFADWTVSTISEEGWGPDGNSTALGSLHSNCLAVAAEAGGGVRWSKAANAFVAPSGDAARARVTKAFGS